MISKRWAWIAAAAVLFAGLTNAHAHVHFCFDGQEPPTAFHLADPFDPHGPLEHGGHHDHAANDGNAGTDTGAGDHDDRDVDIPNSAVAKSVKYDLVAITPAARSALDIDVERRDSLTRRDPVAPVSAALYARPPLRGPPR
jgi:hypothetical protein